ncbi:hypothetical protein Saro_0656 [Novosphingobium aromaticivorans DSM 12444]|uniref:Uncharacterized protein n=1 Tax=Novosphingobium aromaticivorans (strain ATCC 700278 / DSM 12444 / CCUG 56034 / CIP 105152 / NBRC 16084 / F199) TaxID=279238 RepID=Q2GAM0_NOVAD|nr:hypothetical protein [Novosphingobium aromaticivorans]ABD25103.1 hypothetical protein Saro_0656 [Novosphingobium aromaticivorans DSM 12444]SCY95803.1 hypothetical protein SAMN05660666_03880 [Novosphingobium aromaticivorans]
MSKKNAIVIRKRGVNHGDDHFPAGTVIRDMPEGQFKDWSDIGIVREASDAEVAAGGPGKQSKPRRSDEAAE